MQLVVNIAETLSFDHDAVVLFLETDFSLGSRQLLRLPGVQLDLVKAQFVTRLDHIGIHLLTEDKPNNAVTLDFRQFNSNHDRLVRLHGNST